MNVIVAVDNKWAIGKNNELLVRIPADQRFFREETTNKVIIMGRKTLESFPQKKPLPNRQNIVISRKEDYVVEGATVVSSIEEALELVKDYNSEDVYVIGGDSIYHQMLQYCDVAHVTKINYRYDADTYFPNLDQMSEWKIEQESEEQTYYDIEYSFVKYVRAK